MALTDLRVEREWDIGADAIACFDSNLERYVRVDTKEGAITVRRVADDRELFRLPHLWRRGTGTRAFFSPDGRLLALKALIDEEQERQQQSGEGNSEQQQQERKQERQQKRKTVIKFFNSS